MIYTTPIPEVSLTPAGSSRFPCFNMYNAGIDSAFGSSYHSFLLRNIDTSLSIYLNRILPTLPISLRSSPSLSGHYAYTNKGLPRIFRAIFSKLRRNYPCFGTLLDFREVSIHPSTLMYNVTLNLRNSPGIIRYINYINALFLKKEINLEFVYSVEDDNRIYLGFRVPFVVNGLPDVTSYIVVSYVPLLITIFTTILRYEFTRSTP